MDQAESAALAEGAVEEDRPTTSESPPLKMVAFVAATTCPPNAYLDGGSYTCYPGFTGPDCGVK